MPWFAPGFALGGALDTGLFLALAGVVILAGQVADLSSLRQRAN